MVKAPEMTIFNAREAQAKAESPAEFFEQYGFVLLSHKSEVQDWNIDP